MNPSVRFIDLCANGHRHLREHAVLFRWCTTLVGHQDDGEGGSLELRNCRACGSTLAIAIEASAQERAA